MSDETKAWDNSDMKTKAWVIKQAVQSGFSKDLNEIKDMYNYIATMEKVAKDNHKNWGESEDESLLRILNSNDYDYKGYYKKYPQSNANSKTHWNDEFKTVYHPTFSEESTYSGVKSQYNPEGIIGGRWQGNAYIPSEEQLNSRYFNEDRTKNYLKNSPEYLQMPKKKYDDGGPTDENVEYNIFKDPKSFSGRDQHRKSLESFVKNNPKLYGLNTADFVDFLSQIAGLESGYRSKATNNASTYSGYYGLKNGHTFDDDTQHKKAFHHLSKIFKENITKQDIDKASSLGITPAQLLAKYWNQGNRVTNYLYNNIDNEDALGTKISKYGWNVTAPVEYKDLVPEAITDGYIIIENAKSLPNAISRARNKSIDYSDRENSILQLNDSINPLGFVVKKFDPNKLKKGRKVKLMSDDEYAIKQMKEKYFENYNLDNLLNNSYLESIDSIMHLGIPNMLNMRIPQHFNKFNFGGPTDDFGEIMSYYVPDENVFVPDQQYLDAQNYQNKTMIFGLPEIKIPNRDQDKYFYNAYLNFSENNPNLIDGNYAADYSFDMDCTGLQGCARYVTKIFEGANGNSSKQAGVFSDAWKMPKLIEDNGGNIIYNIYDNDFEGISDVSTLKSKTEEKLKANPVNIKNLKIGDVVGIYNPRSTMHTTALKEGTTKNTHVGIVYAFDDDGMPLVRHLVGKTELKDRADDLGNIFNNSKISVVARPKYSNLKPILFEPKSSRFYIENAIPEMIQYMDSIEGAMDIIGQFYPNANMEEVAKAAIAIMKRETNYGTNTISKQLNSGEIKPQVMNTARNIAYKFSNKNKENISSDFSKFKLATLTPDERVVLGINSPEDLNDPNKAGIASLYILSKNYDYFKRYAMQNPRLGLTDDDILNATILSYNQGMHKLYSLGADEQGFPKQEELEALRYLSDYNNKIYDLNSTNYKYLGPLGRFLYEKLEDPNIPYIGSARKEMENTIRYKKDLTYDGGTLPEIIVTDKKPNKKDNH